MLPGESRKRGPKKGEVRALRAQIATLEQQLIARDPTWAVTSNLQDLNMKPVDQCSHSIQLNTNSPLSASIDTSIFEMTSAFTWPEKELIPLDTPLMTESYSPPTPFTLTSLCLPAPIETELEQLFFDRVYPSAPIIHKDLYATCMNQQELPPASACLRLAVCTSATAFSAQYRDIGETFYHKTLESLENLESSEHSLPWGAKYFQIEHIQAWLLLAIYEFKSMKGTQENAAASRALRLIRRCRLGDLDASDVFIQQGTYTASAAKNSFAVVEEQRRTFWLAFCFERMLNTKDDLDRVLPEEMIRLRVPASDTNFQNSVQTTTPFLSDIMAEGNDEPFPPFAEFVVLTALYERCVVHRQLVSTAGGGGGGSKSKEFWIRHSWLMSAVEKRIQQLQALDIEPNVLGDDPMLAFTYIFARSLVIHLVDTANIWPWHTVEQERICLAYKQQASVAVNELAQVASSLPYFSDFKAHLFLPRILASSVDFICRHGEQMIPQAVKGDYWDVAALTKVLHRLEDINKWGKETLDQVYREGEVGVGC
ncbi:hypothetical protein PTNB73_10303 [Pyrenophora teres f. teres]|nr:hypothetical protein HRS9122_08379 [Pyrenophora teres f. teres]KAE8854873.1 hypothetical protein PTNB73_10303 [Pyrenophora teres f. teres]